MFDKMKQLYDMQKQARQMQKMQEENKIEKTALDGKIKLTMNGAFKVEQLEIDPVLLQASNKTLLEEELKNIISNTAEELTKKSAEQAMEMMKQMNIKLPGF
ncbi:MAG: YbaB/EbfC family nucleoid-associated protein [Elusimicrobiota bacterium]